MQVVDEIMEILTTKKGAILKEVLADHLINQYYHVSIHCLLRIFMELLCNFLEAIGHGSRITLLHAGKKSSVS